MGKKVFPLATSTWSVAEKAAAIRVIVSGQLTLGKNVSKFEKKFSQYIGAKWAIMVNSGSSANLLAAAALKLKYKEAFEEKNEIIVPTVSWSTTYFPWYQMGFKLRFVDISAKDFNIDVDKLLPAISEKTFGICVVHLLGAPANMSTIMKIVRDKDLVLIEDACESMGSTFKNRKVGTFGEVGTFSTFFSHHISTGEGGFVITNDDEIAHYIISLRAHGWLRNLENHNLVSNKTGNAWLDNFRFYLPGYNLRPMEVQAAPGIVQLSKLDKFNALRIQNASYLQECIKDILWLNLQQPLEQSTWFAFGLLVNPNFGISREKLVHFLSKSGVESRPVVTGNFTQNPVMKLMEVANSGEKFSIAENIDRNGLMLGNHPYDLRKKIDKMVQLLKRFENQI